MPYKYKNNKQLLKDSWDALFCTDYFNYDFNLITCMVYPLLILIAMIVGIISINLASGSGIPRAMLFLSYTLWLFLLTIGVVLIQYIYNIYMFKRK